MYWKDGRELQQSPESSCVSRWWQICKQPLQRSDDGALPGDTVFDGLKSRDQDPVFEKKEGLGW